MSDFAQFLPLFDQARAHRLTHGCSAHPFGDGASLFALAQAQQPQRILELGTGVGYTACVLAAACPHAHIDTLEGDATHAQLARELLQAQGLAARVHVLEGAFADTLGTVQGPYGLIFFDGHAPPLIVVKHLHSLLADNGLLVCSNMRLRGTRGVPRIEAEFDDASRWQRIGTMEGGNTAILQKASRA